MSSALNGSVDAGPNLSASSPAASAWPPHIIRSMFTQWAANAHLFRVRALQLSGVPLTSEEEALLVHGWSGLSANTPPQGPRAIRDSVDELAAAVEDEAAKPLAPATSQLPNAAPRAFAEATDMVFRFAFENFALRIETQKAVEANSATSRSKLIDVVQFQRRELDAAEHAKNQLQKQMESMNLEASNLRKQLSTKDQSHKKEFDSYLREICVLKEQLYRSYRDKQFVGKPVDMLRLIVDEDTAEDVSVDELLRCRRVVRGVEQEMAALNEKIQLFQTEAQMKAKYALKMEERAKAADAVAASLRSDAEQLHAMIDKLERDNAGLISDITEMERRLMLADRHRDELQATMERSVRSAHAQEVAFSALGSSSRDGAPPGHFDGRHRETTDRPAGAAASAVPRRNVETQTTPTAATVSEFDVGAETIPATFRAKTRLQWYELHTATLESIKQTDAAHTAQLAAAREEGEAKREILVRERDAVQAELVRTTLTLETTEAKRAALEQQLKGAEEELAVAKDMVRDAETLQQAAETKAAAAALAQEKAEAAQQVAEARASKTVELCVEASRLAAAELSSSQVLLTELQQRNEALSQGYVNMAERLEEIKSRAGLRGYKRRANEFHHHRAQTAIRAAEHDAAERIAAANAVQDAAVRKAEALAQQLRTLSGEYEAAKRAHADEVKSLADHTKAVQEAFEALLADFDRLRADYLKAAGNHAAAGGASTRGGGGGLAGSMMSGAVAIGGSKELADRQRYSFETLLPHRAAEQTLLQVLSQVIELSRRPLSVEILLAPPPGAPPKTSAPVPPTTTEDVVAPSSSGAVVTDDDIQLQAASTAAAATKRLSAFVQQLLGVLGVVTGVEGALQSKLQQHATAKAAQKATAGKSTSLTRASAAAPPPTPASLSDVHAAITSSTDLAAAGLALRRQGAAAAWEILRECAKTDAFLCSAVRDLRDIFATATLIRTADADEAPPVSPLADVLSQEPAKLQSAPALRQSTSSAALTLLPAPAARDGQPAPSSKDTPNTMTLEEARRSAVRDVLGADGLCQSMGPTSRGAKRDSSPAGSFRSAAATSSMPLAKDESQYVDVLSGAPRGVISPKMGGPNRDGSGGDWRRNSDSDVPARRHAAKLVTSAAKTTSRLARDITHEDAASGGGSSHFAAAGDMTSLLSPFQSSAHRPPPAAYAVDASVPLPPLSQVSSMPGGEVAPLRSPPLPPAATSSPPIHDDACFRDYASVAGHLGALRRAFAGGATPAAVPSGRQVASPFDGLRVVREAEKEEGAAAATLRTTAGGRSPAGFLPSPWMRLKKTSAESSADVVDGADVGSPVAPPERNFRVSVANPKTPGGMGPRHHHHQSAH